MQPGNRLKKDDAPVNRVHLYFVHMPTILEAIREIEKIAPPALAADWDNSGLQVGEMSAKVGKVLVALDPLPDVMDEADRMGAGLVVTHHPLFFRDVKSLDLANGLGATVGKAVRYSITIYSAHTSFDRVPKGISGALADAIGLQKHSVLEQAEGWPKGYGFGRIGRLAKKTTVGEFSRMLKNTFGLKGVRLVGDPKRAVKTIALCGGSGSDLIPAAVRAGADVFVTGDLKYHDALGALESGMPVIDIGHFASEMPGVPRMAELLDAAFRKKGWKVEMGVSRAQGEPWTYV